MRRLAHIAVVLLLSSFLLADGEAVAWEHLDPTSPPSAVVDLDDRFEKGFSLYQEGEYEQSIEYFQRILGENATYAHEEHGLAAYWNGRALEALGRDLEALTLYQATLSVLEDVDIRLADAYVRGVFAREKEAAYASAASHYLGLIGKAGQPLRARDQEILDEHLTELCLVLPHEVSMSAGLQGCDPERYAAQRAPASGTVLVEWWRGENLNLSTRTNERLKEHLERVAHARENYSHNGRLEDRGEIYVRFGPPEWRRQVRLDELSNFEESQALSLAIGTAFELERNEYWIYPSVHNRAYFLFVWNRERGYRLADASDLIPRSLTSGSRNAPLAITVMEYVYRQLSVHAHDYVRTYNQVADYKSDFDRIQTFGRMGGPGDLDLPPGSFVQMTMSRARDHDREIRKLRAEDIPVASTNLDDDLEDLPGTVRTARFLEEDGSTRTEVYWAALVEDLETNRRIRRLLRRADLDQDVPEGYLMLTTLLKQTEDYEEQTRLSKRQQLGPFSDDDQHGMVSPQTYVVAGDTTDYILSAQWDQYVLYREDGDSEPKVGPQVKVQRYRSTPMRALNTDSGTLEMSDLKPLVFVSADATEPIEDNTIVYPYERIFSDTELALYFEVYNLFFDADDQTRFTAEYEVTREVRPGFFGRLVGRGSRLERTTVAHEYVNDGRRAGEYVILDLADFDAERANNLEITLRVRDEVSGQEVERSLAFDIVAPVE